ncbi:MAG: PstS family phosphate ABC transporter substrate-binding protein [Gemmataceae bacterium]|nr:PstS family phosphate ABC transporter substrate-binding protein [Gemmataceae bacterium]MDW8266163.1 PstS family phosphate ABC transporter substrate-binding protein [Gemmataceae bacterium]
MNWSVALMLWTLPGVVGAGGQSPPVQVDPRLRPYAPVGGVSGNLKSIGSDTMSNLMTLWAEGFQRFYPHVQIEIEGKGSTTAPPALIAGTAHFGPMSRPMKQAEIDQFEARFGYKPTALPTAIDMLAIYVHQDNPLPSLTMAQVDAIFSKTRRAGHRLDIRTWGDLGLTGDWANKPISLYGRNSASGTYGYFKEHVLLNGDFKDEVKEQPGSSSVIQGIASDRYAIGYSGMGYRTADVRAVPLARSSRSAPVEPTPENAYTGAYPMARFLYVYANIRPKTPLDPLRREFIRYIFSKDGQEVVIRDGYYPITSPIAERILKSLGID